MHDRKTESLHGILAVDKPFGMTSHDVVARVRRLSGQRAVGHAGTLDPMATGLLLLCIGNATRLSEYLMDGAKWYLGRIAFGTRTDTDDALGRAVTVSHRTCQEDDVRHALSTHVGPFAQVPPSYAAIKRDGVPAYKDARAGKDVSLGARPVVVHEIHLLRFQEENKIEHAQAALFSSASADVLIACAKGTYIRSIARDVGSQIGCGAHLAGLRRLAVGSFNTEDAVSLKALEVEVAVRGVRALAGYVRRADRAVSEMPAVLAGAELARGVGSGRPFVVPGSGAPRKARLYDDAGRLLALASCTPGPDSASRLQPEKVFVPSGAD